MEKGQFDSSTKPKGACEKIYKAVTGNRPFGSLRRHADGSQSPMSVPGGRTTASPSKTHFFLRKHVTPHKPLPPQVNIPSEGGPSVVMNQKEKMVKAPVPQSQPAKPAPVKVKTFVAPVNSVGEKPKKKAETEIRQSKMIVVQGPTKPPMPGQGVLPKPKSQPAALAKQGGTQDKKPEKGGAYDHNQKYSTYIERVKNEMRAKSDVNEETTIAKLPTRIPTRRDSFKDRVSNFITRARKNIRTTNLGD